MNAAAIHQRSIEHLESAYLGTAIDWGELKGAAGKEHYKLLSYLSSLHQGRDIFDIGTHRGASALAIASGSETNHIYSFDLNHIYPLPSVPNVTYHTENLLSEAGRAVWQEKLLGSAFIFLDIDPHEGTREYEFYLWLKGHNYQGFVICDDIWYFKEMRDNFWFKIPAAEKVDVTSMGHWSGTGVLRFTPSDLWPAIHIPDNWTVVTAYFDLTKMSDASKSIKDRPSTHYLENARATMSTEQNLVVFCEPDSVELLRQMRPPWLQQKTKYIPVSFEDFPMTQYRAKIQENRRQKPYAFDDRNTASYYLLCMSRYAMLKRIIEENPFQSTHFAWLNICIERMGWKNVMALDDVWTQKRDKFSTCYIDYQPESLVKNTAEYYKWGRCSLCSGFFTGSAYYMKAFCDSIEEQFLHMLQLGYGHADEQLFSLVFFKNRDIFEVYYGDYQEMIVNYVEPRERPSEPLRLLIAHSFAAKDYDVCEKGCAALWAAFKKGVAILSIGEVDQLIQLYRATLEKQGKGRALP
ncbi:hypothetical protein EBR66_04985 [bacterium]|nr:hypothetical protein [bacterium]